MARTVVVELVGDDTSLRKAFARSTRGAKEFEQTIGRAGRGSVAATGAFHSLGRSIAFASGTFLGAAGLTSVLKNSISAASDLHEQINKVNVVFRGSQASVLKWSEGTAKGLGMARSQALGFAATFGNLLVPMGIARDTAAKMSVQFVKLAADLASFNNASPEDTLKALQSGLAGQVRPLRQYGIFLDQARIKAEALRMGLLRGNVDKEKVRIADERIAISQAQYNKALKDYGPNSTQAASAHVRLESAQQALRKATAGVTGQLTQQQKVLATTAIIMRDSKDAQGDFARTSGGLANQQRILRAQITDTEEKLGTALLPTVLKVTKSINDWLSSTRNQKELQKGLNTVINDATVLFRVLQGLAKNLAPLIQGVANAVGGTKNAFKLLIGLAIAAKITKISQAFTGPTGLAGSIGTANKQLAGKTGLLANLSALSKFSQAGIIISVVLSIKSVLDPKSELFPHSLFGPSSGIGKLGHLLGIGGGGGKKGPSSGALGAAAVGSMTGGVQIGTGVAAHSTHPTAGLPGFPAVDIMASPGTPVRAPENCTLTRRHFINWDMKKRIGGWTCYLIGHQTGSVYFVTHLGSCGGEGYYKKGAVFGTVAAVPGHAWASHVHVGQEAGGAAASIGGAAGSAGSVSPTSGGGGGGGGGGGSTGGLTVGTKAGSSSWKGATQATITAARASVTATIANAMKSIGGIAGPMDAIEKNAIAQLKKLREHLKIHMSAADLATTRASIAKWGKILNDEVARQTKKAARAFDRIKNQLLRNFDRETEAGLRALGAPDETPAEKALRELQESHDDAARQQALADAEKSGDAQAVADALYDIQVAALQKQADAERKQADEDAAARQQAYQDQRDDQRQALEDQLDDWNEWLTNKKKSWNEFWAWVKANPHGGPITAPDLGDTSTAPTFFTNGPPKTGVPGVTGGVNRGIPTTNINPGPGVKVFDSGGWLMPGMMGINLSRRAEYVDPHPGRRGATVIVNVAGSVKTERELVEAVRDGLVRIGVRNGSTGIV